MKLSIRTHSCQWKADTARCFYFSSATSNKTTMCLFQSGKDIPPFVRLSLRTLQYLVIPLLSLSIVIVGALHIDDCKIQPLLPIWHIVAGSSGLCTPFFYLLFDDVSPWLTRRFPGISDFIDNAVVCLLPIYIVFEVAWLITGTFWVMGTPEVENPEMCHHTVYVFSYVVVVNFWIHILTPLVFMFGLCCTRICPYCGYCAYWNFLKKAMDNWTRRTRMIICSLVAFPLAISMITVGAISIEQCSKEVNNSSSLTTESQIQDDMVISENKSSISMMTHLEKVHIPVWLLVSGCAVFFVPGIYFIYDKYCKTESGGPLIKSASKWLVISFLLCGLAWSIVGFLWVFSAHDHETCGNDTATYQFAYATLIILNFIMDIWICFKICVVLYWAFLSDE